MKQPQEQHRASRPAEELYWLCAGCAGELGECGEESVRCEHCGAEYTAVAGIPDLRMGRGNAAWEQEDLARARQLAATARAVDLRAVVGQVSERPSQQEREMRFAQILSAHAKFTHQFKGWLRPVVEREGLVLDIGCGTGGFLAAAKLLGLSAAGIDASMTNLVAAKLMIESHGGVAQLACAYAEYLPVADRQIAAITLHDAIEHVGSVTRSITEAHRVLEVGGFLAIATPNRFSLTREPHVLLWGVGWLPRRFQAAYVHWRIDQPYDHTLLMSTWEFARILQRQQGLEFRIIVPPVPAEEIAAFAPLRATLAKLYNRVHHWPVVRPLMLLIGPFYQVAATRTA